MRSFLVLCFVAVCAADVSELSDDGYNYHHPMGGHEMEETMEAGDSGHNMGSVVESGSASLVDPIFFQQSARPAPVEQAYDSAPTVSKRFFTVTAQDDDHDDDDDDGYNSGSAHKNYDVVFAKAPAPSVKSALKAFANFAGQHQTAVYVLSKKLGADEIGNALRASGIKPNRPEVHFIKYKTPEEAAYAQSQVKAKYDAFGGHSEFAGEQRAPVHSVIGSLGHYRQRPSYSGSSGHSHHGGYSNSGRRVTGPFTSSRYLPPTY